MKALASIFGIGFLKGGGTWAALLTVLVWYWAQPSVILQIACVVVFFILSVWTGNVVEKDWGKDSSKVVIDEVIGMMITLLFVPITWWWCLIAFVLFRVFDIAKPLGIRKMEVFKGGVGVTMDDVLAGVYGNMVLQLILLIFDK